MRKIAFNPPRAAIPSTIHAPTVVPGPLKPARGVRGSFPSSYSALEKYNTSLANPNLSDFSVSLGQSNETPYPTVGINVPGYSTFFKVLGTEVADLIKGLFGGRPKLEDTANAASRLLQSRNPAVRLFGGQLARLANQGVPLSDSNPAVQKLFGELWHNAVIGIEQTTGWSRQRAFNALNDVVSSGIARSGLSIPAGQFASVSKSAPSIVSSGSSRIPTLLPSQPNLLTPEGGELIGAQVAGAEGAEIGKIIGQEAANLTRYVRSINPQAYDYIQGQPQAQPEIPLGYQPSNPPGAFVSGGGQPQLAPLLDTEKPCPECGFQPAIQSELRAQQGQLERSQRIEEQQLEQQRIQQRESDIQQLQQLEEQPASSRDIPRELQYKSALLQQVNQELQTGKPSGVPAQPSTPAQPYRPGQYSENNPAPLLEQPEQQPSGGTPASEQYEHLEAIEQAENENLNDGVNPKVKFCVECANQHESRLFLMGESSACTVLPD